MLPARAAAVHRVARTRAASTRTAVSVLRPAAAAPRESPVPVVLLSSSWHTAAATFGRAGLPARLTDSGYTVALVDLPGFGAARSMPASWSVDDLVEDVHAAVLGALRHPAPVAVAHSAAAVLMGKYLESWALSGLVKLAPLPPAPAPVLRRWLGVADADPVVADDVAAFLRASASSPESVKHVLLAGRRCPDASAEACFADAEPQCHVDVAAAGADATAPRTHLCGVDATAHFLASVAVSPVNLEPRPIPMCVVAPHPGADAAARLRAGDAGAAEADSERGADRLVTWREVRARVGGGDRAVNERGRHGDPWLHIDARAMPARCLPVSSFLTAQSLETIDFHDLHTVEGGVHFVPAQWPPAATAGDGKQSPSQRHTVGHAMTYASPQEAAELTDTVVAWIAARF
jgi:pimeloyl-ACP methyl ester carboxylesterase